MCLKGPPLSPLNTLWLFSSNSFLIILFNIYKKKCIWYRFKIFSQKYAHNKKKLNFWPQCLQIAVFQQIFPNNGETLYFGGIVNQKTFLNHELGSKFFFLLHSLAYKLVNPLVFEKNSCKMKKNLFFFFNYWSGTQLYLLIWSLF